MTILVSGGAKYIGSHMELPSIFCVAEVLPPLSIVVKPVGIRCSTLLRPLNVYADAVPAD
jgi:hypothetical protein